MNYSILFIFLGTIATLSACTLNNEKGTDLAAEQSETDLLFAISDIQLEDFETMGELLEIGYINSSDVKK